MKIFDCVTFFNEHDIFDIRYKALKDEVDYFVVIEGSKTFDGQKKDFCFKYQNYDENKIRYIKINEFHENISLNDYPEYYDDCSKYRMLDGLYGANYNDIILISDCDEIPHPETLKKIRKFKNSKIGICFQNMVCVDYMHFIKTKWFWFNRWPGTKFMKYKDLVNPKSLKWFHQPRLYDPRNYLKYNIILDKGFHFTWIGNLEAALNKYQALENVHRNDSTKETGYKTHTKETIKKVYDDFLEGKNFRLPFCNYDIKKDDPKKRYDEIFYKILKEKSLI